MLLKRLICQRAIWNLRLPRPDLITVPACLQHNRCGRLQPRVGGPPASTDSSSPPPSDEIEDAPAGPVETAGASPAPTASPPTASWAGSPIGWPSAGGPASIASGVLRTPGGPSGLLDRCLRPSWTIRQGGHLGDYATAQRQEGPTIWDVFDRDPRAMILRPGMQAGR
jgi:hypothetical protein